MIITTTGADELIRRLRRLGSGPADALLSTAIDAEDHVAKRAATHNVRGRLVRSVVRQRSGDDWIVGHDQQHAPYARFVILGARPHLIRPKAKRVLRWPSGGGWRFAKVVHHPGYKGDNYLAEAAKQAPADFRRHLERLIKGG